MAPHDGAPEGEPAAEQKKGGLSSDAPEFKPGAAWEAPDAEKQQNDGTLAANAGEADGKGWESWLRGGYFDHGLGWWVPYHVGKLKSYNMRTGYGFLDCNVTLGIYKTDVYIHKNQVPVPWNVGQSLEFAVVLNNRGQPQASDVLWLPVERKDQTKEKDGAAEDAAAGSGKVSDRLLGMLKSYSTSQGYGFIACDEIFEQQSRDVYLDRGGLSTSGEWRLGQPVEFEVTFNRRGFPQARNCNWDPVPYLQRDGVMPVGPRTLDAVASRTLGKLLAHLRNKDATAAVTAGMDLAASQTDSVDYVFFVLDRLEPVQAGAAQIGDMNAMLLLMALAKALRTTAYPEDRIIRSLAWCEAILPKMQQDGATEELKLVNVIALVKSDLAAAMAVGIHTERFEEVLGKVNALAPHAGAAAPPVAAPAPAAPA